MQSASRIAVNRRLMPMQHIVVCAYGLLLAVAVGREQWLLVPPILLFPLVILRPIECSLGLFAALVPFDTMATLSRSPGGPGTGITWYLGAGAGVALIVAGLVGNRFVWPQKGAAYWAALIAWGTVTAAWAADSRTALERVPTAFALLLLYLAAVSVRISRRELLGIAVLTVAGGSVAAAYTAILYHHGVSWAGGRASLVAQGHLTDPNVLAASQLLPFSLTLSGLFNARSSHQRVLHLVAFGLITYGLLLEMSRGALIAAGVSALVLIWRYRPPLRVLGWLSPVAILAITVPSTFYARMETGLSSRASGRFDIWSTAFPMLRDWWYRGAGFDNFAVVYVKHAGNATFFGGYQNQAHELFLSVAVELGVIGLFLLLAAIGSQLRSASEFMSVRGQRSFPIAIACEAACWGMLVMSLSLDTLWLKSFWLSWILLAVAVRTCRNEQFVALS